MTDDEYRDRVIAMMRNGSPSAGDNLLGMEIDFDIRLGDLVALDPDSVHVDSTPHAEQLINARCKTADGFTLDVAIEAIDREWEDNLRYAFAASHVWSVEGDLARMRFATQMQPAGLYVTGEVLVEPPIRSGLPEGWTMRRVREVAGGHAELVPLTVPVTIELVNGERTAIRPTAILDFSGLHLVRDEDGVWCMGQLDDEDVIRCWAGYGTDLEDAIRGL